MYWLIMRMRGRARKRSSGTDFLLEVEKEAAEGQMPCITISTTRLSRSVISIDPVQKILNTPVT